MSEVTKCAACGKEKPVGEMKTCMHAQMHRYVCDSKCMNDFYNPPKKPADRDRIAALEAECERLKNSLLAITARHFAESWKKRTSDAELEQYLSAGIAQLEAECERLREKLAETKEQSETRWAGYVRESNLRREIEAERDALTAELAAIKGQEPAGVVLLSKGVGISMLRVAMCTPLRPGTKLYTLPAAPEGGEV